MKKASFILLLVNLVVFIAIISSFKDVRKDILPIEKYVVTDRQQLLNTIANQQKELDANNRELKLQYEYEDNRCVCIPWETESNVNDPALTHRDICGTNGVPTPTVTPIIVSYPYKKTITPIPTK